MVVQILLLLVGLALVVFGADFLVEGASAIARRFGLSEFIIGLTIVGMGTSAPEMVVSFIGAAQGNADIALGNVAGSNIANIGLILGAPGKTGKRTFPSIFSSPCCSLSWAWNILCWALERTV